MFTQDYFILSFLIAVLSYVYTNVLTEPTQIFSKWKAFLHNKLNDEAILNEGGDYHPLYKVLVHCEKCFGGQLALWTYMVLAYGSYANNILIAKAMFILILKHLCFIALTIFITIIIKKLADKI